MDLYSEEYALNLDMLDALSPYRNEFIIPKHGGQEVHYFTGNSLGLQPKSAKKYIEEELQDWADLGVEGHFQAKRDWFGYHHYLVDKASKLVGAMPSEVAIMNSLTVNLNLLMISFYQPKGVRTKIMMEASAFPSDHYAVQQQVKLHNLNPENEIILLKPREGEETLRTDDIIKKIEENSETLALVMLGGVNYYTGQYFELQKITQKAHEVGALAGFDLAHAAGNVLLKLHDWNVDFACWCSYKYLNSGPGSVASIFVHEMHGNNPDLPRLAGWWGYDEKTRFEMHKNFVPAQGAAGWQQSNAPVLSMSVHLASLDIFDQVGMEALRAKSLQMTNYLESLILQIPQIHIITPSNPDERGCQLSLVASQRPKELFKYLQDKGIIADWREPDVIRVAPVPLYNTFRDCLALASSIREFYKA